MERTVAIWATKPLKKPPWKEVKRKKGFLICNILYITLGRCSAIYFGIMSHLCVVRMWKWNYFILYDLLISKYVIKYARSVFSPTIFRSAALLFQWLHLWGSIWSCLILWIRKYFLIFYLLKGPKYSRGIIPWGKCNRAL